MIKIHQWLSRASFDESAHPAISFRRKVAGFDLFKFALVLLFATIHARVVNFKQAEDS
ncbi:MAG: hypothetical protein ABI954_04950 [Pyrinomonadaceae bacterium]